MKTKIGKDLRELLNDEYLSIMAIGHLEAWEERYKNYKTRKDLMFDLRVNYDNSLEIERVEEDLKRPLNDDEMHFVENNFHKSVNKHWRSNSIY